MIMITLMMITMLLLKHIHMHNADNLIAFINDNNIDTILNTIINDSHTSNINRL